MFVLTFIMKFCFYDQTREEGEKGGILNVVPFYGCLKSRERKICVCGSFYGYKISKL